MRSARWTADGRRSGRSASGQRRRDALVADPDHGLHDGDRFWRTLDLVGWWTRQADAKAGYVLVATSAAIAILVQRVADVGLASFAGILWSLSLLMLLVCATMAAWVLAPVTRIPGESSAGAARLLHFGDIARTPAEGFVKDLLNAAEDDGGARLHRAVAHQVWAVSTVARAKHRGVRRAIWVLVLSVLLAAVAALVTALPWRAL